MARPLVADGGNGLQVPRVAANILNKLSPTADKGWLPRLGFGRGTNNSSPKKTVCYEMLRRASDLDGFFGTA
jgi:hypothetical protein